MKRLTTFLALFTTIFCSAQVNYLPMPDDFCSNSPSSQSFSMTSTTSSTHGWVHTPKGNLHILVIFYKGENNQPDPSWGGYPCNPPAISSGGVCTSQSLAFSNIYEDFYNSDLAFWIPDDLTPVKTLNGLQTG